MHAPKGVYANFPFCCLPTSSHLSTHVPVTTELEQAPKHALTHLLTHGDSSGVDVLAVKPWRLALSSPQSASCSCASPLHMEGYNFSPEKLTSGKLKTFENFTLRAETLHTRVEHTHGRAPRIENRKGESRRLFMVEVVESRSVGRPYVISESWCLVGLGREGAQNLY